MNVESLPRKPFVKRVLVSFKTPPTFKLRTISAMPFEFQGWLQKSLEKMLTNFSYCIFENQMNDEELHQQLELTEELKGTLETIDKILIGDKRKLAQTPDFDDSSYRHKFQNKKSLSSKCDYCKKHGIEWLCRVCGYKCHNHCKSLVHRSEKCSTNLVRFIPILEKALV